MTSSHLQNQHYLGDFILQIQLPVQSITLSMSGTQLLCAVSGTLRESLSSQSEPIDGIKTKWEPVEVLGHSKNKKKAVIPSRTGWSFYRTCENLGKVLGKSETLIMLWVLLVRTWARLKAHWERREGLRLPWQPEKSLGPMLNLYKVFIDQ